MRVLLDTCVVVDWTIEPRKLNDGVWDIIDDPENRIFISAETVRELVVSFNNKKLLSKRWKTSTDVLKFVEEELGIEFLPIRRDVGYAYSRLQLNEAGDHRDPSDHMIIAHAITARMPLLSSDHNFPFYRNQGLELIEY